MNTFIDLVFIFVFVFVLTNLLIPLHRMDVVGQKLIVFLSVSIFSTFLYVIKSIRKQQIVDFQNAIQSGLLIGLYAFIGHTLLFDLFYMPGTRDSIDGLRKNTIGGINTLVALSIVLTIIVGKSMKIIFTQDD